MKRLLLLDADIIIDLHSLDLFDRLKHGYEILITQAILTEADYYRQNGRSFKIDITQHVTIIPDFAAELLQPVSAAADKAKLRIDPGEQTAIAYLLHNNDETMFCTCDKAAIKLIAFLQLESKAISLEKALKGSNHKTRLWPRHLEKAFKECIRDGKALFVQYGMNL